MLHPHASPPIDGMSTPRRVSSVATLIDEISEEENQLRAVLAEILSRRPIRDGLTETQALPPTPKPVIGYDLVEPPVGSGEGFAWQSENGDTNTEQSGASANLLSPADDVAVNDHVPLSGALQWLTRARTARRWANARRAGAWLLTIGVGGGLIAVAAYFLTGSTLDLPALLSAGVARIF